MKKKEYPLQAAVEVRQRDHDAARKGLALAIKRLDQEQTLLRRLEKELEELRDQVRETHEHLYDTPQDRMLEIADIEQRRASLRALQRRAEAWHEKVSRQNDMVEQATGELEQARRQLNVSARALKAVEEHRENWLRERRKEAARKEERSLQEIATNIYRQQQDGAQP